MEGVLEMMVTGGAAGAGGKITAAGGAKEMDTTGAGAGDDWRELAALLGALFTSSS